MKEHMILNIYCDDFSHLEWVIFSEHNELIQHKTHATLNDLSALQFQGDVVAIVPPQDVLLTYAELPKLSKQKRQQALPFALEEKLIDDVSLLHFATGSYQEDNTYPVAIISKEKMRHWVDTLKAAHIEPTVLIPATLAVNTIDEVWQPYSFGKVTLVRTGKYAGFGIETDTFDTLLSLKLSEIPEKQAIQVLPAKPFNITELQINHIAINLLQDPFLPKRKNSHSKNVWRYAGYLAAAWIAVSLLGDVFSFFVLHYRASSLENQIYAIYHQNFPNATSMVAPRDRMTNKLNQLTLDAQKNNFISLLATVGKGISEANTVRIQNLNYHDGSLTLEIMTANFDNIDELSHQLNNKGLAVKQQNSSTVGSQVKATLLITAGAA